MGASSSCIPFGAESEWKGRGGERRRGEGREGEGKGRRGEQSERDRNERGRGGEEREWEKRGEGEGREVEGEGRGEGTEREGVLYVMQYTRGKIHPQILPFPCTSEQPMHYTCTHITQTHLPVRSLWVLFAVTEQHITHALPAGEGEKTARHLTAHLTTHPSPHHPYP